VDTDLYGFNAEWDVTDRLSLMGDLYRSTSRRHSGGQDTYVVLRMNQPNVTRIELNGDDVPDVWTTFDDGRDLTEGLANGEFGAEDFNTHYMSLGGDNIDDKIEGATLAGDFVFDDSFIRDIDFGVTYTDRRKSRDLVDNTLNGGADYYSGENAINVGDLGGDAIGQVLALPSFMSDVDSAFPRTFLAFDVPNYLQALEAYDGNLRADGTPYEWAAAAPEWNPLQSYRVSEETMALFVQANLGGERWDADVGVRWVTTDTTAQAWDAQIISITENGPFNYTAEYADPTEVTQEGDYDYVLPAANFAWYFSDDLKLRLGAARTMARPPVEQLAPTNTTESVSWGEFTQVFGGNVDLKPYTADQYDISMEWYFSENSIFNVAGFYKRIENQITTSWEENVDIGVPGYNFNIIRPVNGDHAKVEGIEAGLQYFWDNGFTVRAQYTRNWSKSYVDGLERPLEGIAPSVYSFGAWWESGPWSVGANADHTDGFVTATNVLGEGYDEEADAYTWVSAHLAYDINEMFTVSLQGNNLLDAENTYTISGNPILSQGYYRYGRSFNLAVSMAF
jgi:TonB-dependent receptor